MGIHDFSKVAEQRKAAFKRLRDAEKLLGQVADDDDTELTDDEKSLVSLVYPVSVAELK